MDLDTIYEHMLIRMYFLYCIISTYEGFITIVDEVHIEKKKTIIKKLYKICFIHFNDESNLLSLIFSCVY